LRYNSARRDYAQVDRTLNSVGFNTTVDLELGDLPWKEFKEQWRTRFPSPDAPWNRRQAEKTTTTTKSSKKKKQKQKKMKQEL